MATYLNAPSGRFGTPTNAKKYTISTWLKLAVDSSDTNNFFNYNYGSGNQAISIQIRNNDQTLRINQYVPGTDTYDIRTNRVFRDPSAWYHIVIKYDSTQSTASDRVKLYVNGENQTSLAASSYPGQNVDSFIASTPNNNKGINIGGQWDSSGNITANQYFLGYMAQFIYTDGYAYDASTFGSTDANGIWIPNSQPSITYGTNGFKLDFIGTGASADASGFGADSSGNNNHFASNSLGTNPSTSDNPLNNFAVYNAVDTSSNITLSKGNTVATANSNHSASRASMGLRSGKWYWENKIDSVSGGPAVGVIAASAPLANQLNANPSRFYRNNGEKYSNGSGSSYGDTYTTGDIIGVALDMDNGALYFYKNGTIQNSGTAAFTDMITATTTPWLPAVKLYNEAISINFGNPSYTIASGNSDANGYGNFEYAVPSGYYALCTKNLGAYGG